MSKFKDMELFLSEGKAKEEEFIKDLLTEYPDTECRAADKYDDINKHIDIFWKYKNKEYGIDVKGQRRKNRGDNNYSSDTTWIELKNVNGNTGWLYGDEYYIAFEDIDSWYIISREKLQIIVEKSLLSKEIFPYKKGLYYIYQRKGRKEQIIEFPTNIIKNNANRIILKKI